MSLEQLGWIPVSPLPKVGDPNPNEWAGEKYPSCIRMSKGAAAKAWFDRQRWDVQTHNEFHYSRDQVAWCENLGVRFLTVFMGELPNANQS